MKFGRVLSPDLRKFLSAFAGTLQSIIFLLASATLYESTRVRDSNSCQFFEERAPHKRGRGGERVYIVLGLGNLGSVGAFCHALQQQNPPSLDQCWAGIRNHAKCLNWVSGWFLRFITMILTNRNTRFWYITMVLKFAIEKVK
jgi:hypothetical protein